ncbi:hypothetical protein H8D79_01565 [PVC group bacterium]|nr:hypothetical protein [PVC group bacterium]
MGEILLEIRWRAGNVEIERCASESDARRRIRAMAGRRDITEMIVYEARQVAYPGAMSPGLQYVED